MGRYPAAVLLEGDDERKCTAISVTIDLFDTTLLHFVAHGILDRQKIFEMKMQ